MIRHVALLVFSLVAAASLNAADYASYSTADHPKAHGVKITFDYPAGWTPKNNLRPEVVHEFRDPKTGGRDALILVVPEVRPREAAQMAREFREMFALPEAQERMMPGAVHRKKEFIGDLPFPCVALDYDLAIPQLKPAVAQVRNYVLLIGNKMVQIQFYGVAPPETDLRVERQTMMDHVIRSVTVQ